MAGLDDDIQKMKDRMKVEGQDKKPIVQDPSPSGSAESSNNQYETGAKQVMAVPRDPAESLKKLLTNDGVDAVRPGSDAEEQIKRMERQVRTKMKTEREKMLREQQVRTSVNTSTVFVCTPSMSVCGHGFRAMYSAICDAPCTGHSNMKGACKARFSCSLRPVFDVKRRVNHTIAPRMHMPRCKQPHALKQHDCFFV